jgi:hypothetical protein
MMFKLAPRRKGGNNTFPRKRSLARAHPTIAMSWLQRSGKTLSLERARTLNKARLSNRPATFSLLVIAAATWLVVWALASLLLSKNASPLPNARAVSRLRSSKCWLESAGFGYLDDSCSETCPGYASIDEAKAACASAETCKGVTEVPWAGPLRFELRRSLRLVETFDGQRSFLKQCVGGVPVVDAEPQADIDGEAEGSKSAGAEEQQPDEQAAADEHEEEGTEPDDTDNDEEEDANEEDANEEDANEEDANEEEANDEEANDEEANDEEANDGPEDNGEEKDGPKDNPPDADAEEADNPAS